MKHYVCLSALTVGLISHPVVAALARQASAVAAVEVRVVVEPLGVWCESKAAFLIGIENVTNSPDLTVVLTDGTCVVARRAAANSGGKGSDWSDDTTRHLGTVAIIPNHDEAQGKRTYATRW